MLEKLDALARFVGVAGGFAAMLLVWGPSDR